MHLFIYRAGDELIENELFIRKSFMPLQGFSLRLEGKEIIPCSVELSSLASHVSLI